MGDVLHRIEALPGDGRYAVAFRRSDGSEQTAVVHVTGDGVDVAEASLPTGWTRGSDVFAMTAAAVQAVDAARRHGPVAASLRDVEGGWDVSLGNVVLSASGVPSCTAHGEMSLENGSYVCGDCEAQALFG